MQSVIRITMTLLLILTCNVAVAAGLAAFKAEDYDRAYRLWFMTLSENSLDSEANFGLGQIILEGLGTTNADQKEGLSYINTAIDAGSGEAALYLANAYRDGKLFDTNISKEIEYLSRAKKNGISNLSNRLGALYKKRDGALSAQGCKTYNINRKSDAYSIAQCIERGFSDGRAADFYKVAFREGENNAYLRAGKYLLDPVSSDTDYDFMAQYMLAFLRKANKTAVDQFRALIVKNGITAEKCGLQTSDEQNTRGSRNNAENRDRSSSRSSIRDEQSSVRDRGSRESRDRDDRSRDRDSRSSTRDRSDRNVRSSSRTDTIADLNPSLCILAAEGGDPIAQVEVAKWFSVGDYDLALDQEYADQLLQRGSKSGSIAALEQILESLWANGDYEKRITQLYDLILDSKTEQLARDALVKEAEYLLQAAKDDDYKFVPDSLKDEADFILGTVSLNLIRPDLRLVFFEEENFESFGRGARANAERIDLSSEDLFDSYREFFLSRGNYLPRIAEKAMKEALIKQKGRACNLLSYIYDNRRDFGEFGEDLVQDFGEECRVKRPEDYIEIAENYFLADEFDRGLKILGPMMQSQNCDALVLAAKYETKDSRIQKFIQQNEGLVRICNSEAGTQIDLNENRLAAAQEFVNREQFNRAVDQLRLLLAERDCSAFQMALSQQQKSTQISKLINENKDLYEYCAETSEAVALGNLKNKMSTTNKQNVYDLASQYCARETSLSACLVAAELLIDRTNQLTQQAGKNQWSTPSKADLWQLAINNHILFATDKSDVQNSLFLIKAVLFDKHDGTGRFKKDAERAIDRLVSMRNINGQALQTLSQLGIGVNDPLKLLDNVAGALTGTTKRRCEELQGYGKDEGLAEFIKKEISQKFKTGICSTFR